MFLGSPHVVRGFGMLALLLVDSTLHLLLREVALPCQHPSRVDSDLLPLSLLCLNLNQPKLHIECKTTRFKQLLRWASLLEGVAQSCKAKKGPRCLGSPREPESARIPASGFQRSEAQVSRTTPSKPCWAPACTAPWFRICSAVWKGNPKGSKRKSAICVAQMSARSHGML